MAQGRDPLMLQRNLESWAEVGPALDEWIEETSRSLAYACLVAESVMDFEAMVIDGSIPDDVRSRIVEKIRIHLQKLDLRGVPPFSIVEGLIGRDARALGAASLPLFAKFIIDRDILFKEPV